MTTALVNSRQQATACGG